MTSEKFGRYEINKEIGRGGMAAVFHAYDPRFERDVAIKVLPREFLHDPQFRARFEREAKTVALLEHPAIVPVYDFGEEEGQPYIVMRYMSGGSLSERLTSGPLPLHDVLEMITRLAPALDAAHSKGIIHRDLKPGNILFDQYGNSFLSDFGIARLTQSSSATLTGGAILGTPAYMSPEQVQGGLEIDGRSDIYSMGVILYQILAGKTPYRADTAAKLMMMHILEPVPHIRDEKDDLPPAFDEIIEKAMAKDPDDRFQNTVDLSKSVEKAIKSAESETHIGAPIADLAMGKTRIQSGATVVAPLKKPRKTPGPPGTPPPPVAGEIPAKRGGIPNWAWIAGGLVIVAILGIILLSGGAFILGNRPTATLPLPTTAFVAVIPTRSTSTPSPSQTIQLPTDTPIPVDTVAPTSTDTEVPPTPTETLTPVPAPPLLGGADKIAFIKGNDIWLVNLDGSDLTRLTSDGSTKNALQWLPDGSGLVYISGLCIQQVNAETTRVDSIACFEYLSSLDWFAISPDGQQAAIVVNQQLYIIPYDTQQLSQVQYWSEIKAMAPCQDMAPYASSTGTAYAVREARWSDDMQRLALVMLGVEGGRQVDIVRIISIASCIANLASIDEFPSNRFSISGYNTNPTILHLGWDGMFRFGLTGYVRNEGFGDLYFYNLDVHRAELRVNPVNSSCCYRDVSFSPDGSYIAFAFQDINLGAQGTIQLFYIPFGTIGTGLQYTPIPLPEDFFTNPRESPQPVLRPVPPLP